MRATTIFPPGAISDAYVRASRTRTVCPWKGVAHYYDVVVDGQVNRDAAWYYPHPSPLARKIKGHVAFWHGVAIKEDRAERESEPSALIKGRRRLWR